MLNGKVGVCQSLRLNALTCVHNQNSAFAGGKRARDLVVEVHMPRRVNKVEGIGFAIRGLIGKPYGARFDGDTALTLKIHVVQHLRRDITAFYGSAFFEKTVRKR